jgi:hypothetical protein
MIQQLVALLMKNKSLSQSDAALAVLSADPLDLILCMERLWKAFSPSPTPVPGTTRARDLLLQFGEFNTLVLPPVLPPGPPPPVWDHLAYSYVLENTRAVQILRRVVREYRSGEGLGVPTVETQRWLDATEALMFGAPNPIPGWLSISTVRPDPEAVRRNAYWRLLGLDLAFGTDDNRPAAYDKANAANTSFLALFEELLFELWQAMSNVRNTSGVNASDDDRIYRIASELRYVLRSRRQLNTLAREELAAATVLGWADLTLSANTPVVIDLKANATSAADRLRLIGERVGLAAHSKSAAFFSMSAEISIFLRTIEDDTILTGPERAWVLYLTQAPTPAPGDPIDPTPPIGNDSRRVITEWAAATGKDLKVRSKPIEAVRQRQLVAPR